jgi:paraquat-inducible protein B
MESEEVKAMPMNVQAVLNNLNDVLAGFDSDSEFQRELIRTLEELKQTLQSVDAFADQLEERPNSLIFPAKTAPDPEPGARR